MPSPLHAIRAQGKTMSWISTTTALGTQTHRHTRRAAHGQRARQAGHRVSAIHRRRVRTSLFVRGPGPDSRCHSRVDQIDIHRRVSRRTPEPVRSRIDPCSGAASPGSRGAPRPTHQGAFDPSAVESSRAPARCGAARSRFRRKGRAPRGASAYDAFPMQIGQRLQPLPHPWFRIRPACGACPPRCGSVLTGS